MKIKLLTRISTRCNTLFMLFTVLITLWCFNSNAQIFAVQSFDGNGQWSLIAMTDCPPQVLALDGANAIPTYFNGTWYGTTFDYALMADHEEIAECKDIWSTWARVRARSLTANFLSGDSSSFLQFWINSQSRVSMWGDVFGYNALAENSYFTEFSVVIAPGGGYNVGDPIALYSQFSFASNTITQHEAGNEVS